MNAARDKSGNNEIAPGALAVTTGARIPAEVMELVANVGHRQSMNDLRISLRSGIEVDGREIIGFLDVCSCINADHISQLLGRRLARGLGRGKGAALALILAVELLKVQ